MKHGKSWKLFVYLTLALGLTLTAVLSFHIAFTGEAPTERITWLKFRESDALDGTFNIPAAIVGLAHSAFAIYFWNHCFRLKKGN